MAYRDIASGAADGIIKSSPALTTAAWSIWGFTLQDVAAITAITYSVVMVVLAIYDRVQRQKGIPDVSNPN